MSSLKKLASDTAIYGVLTILGRFINFLLVPLYTNLFNKADYGIYTYLMGYVAFTMAFLTYGMETGFFRFASKSENYNKVYSTITLSIILVSVLFVSIINLNVDFIQSLLNVENSEKFLRWLSITVALDAIIAIPLAKLRHQNKALRFTYIRLTNILINIGINVFFLLICRDSKVEFLNNLYDPNIGIGYAYIAFLIANAVAFIMLYKDFMEIRFVFDLTLFKKIFRYSFPIFLVSIFVLVNTQIEKILMLDFLPSNPPPDEQLGIYSANIKLAIIMTLFVQAFRYAFEPFFFKLSQGADSKETYKKVLNYFVIFGLLIVLTVTFFIDFFKILIGKEFHSGLHIVPYVLVAYLFNGIFYSLSLWYKLTDKTIFGTILAGIGAIITLLGNIILLPQYGYMGAVYSMLISFITMTILSYLLGQKYYKIHYDIKSISIYFLIAGLLFIVNLQLKEFNSVFKFILNCFMLIIYVIIVIFKERTLKNIFLKKVFKM